MGKIMLRGRMTADGRIELLDPLPDDVGSNPDVTVIVETSANLIETVNEYDQPVIVDEITGMEMPVAPLTTEELLNSPLIGIWENRQDEIGDSAEWVRELRRDEQERGDPWRGRKLS